jgi:hypothetical protein
MLSPQFDALAILDLVGGVAFAWLALARRQCAPL